MIRSATGWEQKVATVLTQGENAPLLAGRVRIEVRASRPVEISGLLLTAAGRVRSDADLVYVNAPRGAGVTHRPGTGGGPDAIVVDTSAVPADVEKIVVTVGPNPPGTAFAGIEPTVTVRDDVGGREVAGYRPEKPDLETALLLVELYRRGLGWKVRAVGRGYRNGLAGIAAEFGIRFDRTRPQTPPHTPPQTPPPPAGPPRPAAPPAAGRITLDKGKVSLVKGGAVALVKDGEPILAPLRLAVGWEPAESDRAVDLDASCLAYDAKRNKVDTAWFLKLSILDGAVVHAGDRQNDDSGRDDESITVDLEAVPADVCGLVLVLNSFSGRRFSEVKNAYCRLLDAHGSELVRFDLTTAEPHTGVALCKLVRQFSGEWVLTALGEYADAKTARGMVQPAALLL